MAVPKGRRRSRQSQPHGELRVQRPKPGVRLHPAQTHSGRGVAMVITHGRPGPIGFAEARTALAAGEIVIARPAAFLRNGDEVRFGVRVSTPWISAGAEWPWVR